MENSTVIRLGLILAVQAEIDGMKAHNKSKENFEACMVYTQEDFDNKAEELRKLSHCHEDQL